MSNQLQPFVRQYLTSIDLSVFVGVTLTMKQMVDLEKLDPVSSSQNLRHFMNILNKKIFGNRYSRYGLKLQIFPVLEFSLGERLHYHLILEIPRDFDFDGFKHLIHSVWMNTRFGHREIHIDDSIDEGWINYITKFHHSKDQVDWENVHLIR